MAKGLKVRVRIDADLVREAREILGARSNSEAVELALTIALAIRGTDSGDAAKFLGVLGSNRFKP